MARRRVCSPIVSLAALALVGCGSTEAPVSPPPLVRTMMITAAGEDAAATRLTGVIRGRVESDLGFRVGGKIERRLVDPGAVVRRGQLLMELDPSDLALSARSAAEGLAAAAAEDDRARTEEARLRNLVGQGATSRSAYDAALAAARAASANLRAARAAATQAANQRRYARLVADVDGVVIDVLAQPGQVVAAGAVVVRLAQANQREAVVAVPEAMIAELPKLATARLFNGSGPIAARLREVGGSADPLTRTFTARYRLAAADARLPLGATVTLTLQPTRAHRLVSVPLAALTDQGAGAAVWAVGADRIARRRPVRLVRLLDEAALVNAPTLAPGDRIVALGAQLLRDGQPVRVESAGR